MAAPTAAADRYAFGASIAHLVAQRWLGMTREINGHPVDVDLFIEAQLDELHAAGWELVATATSVRVVRSATLSPGEGLAHPLFTDEAVTAGYCDYLAPQLRRALASHPCLGW